MAIGLWSSESAEKRLRIEEMRTPPEKFGGVFRWPKASIVVILGRSPEDLPTSAAMGEVEGGDATADARHKAEHDGTPSGTSLPLNLLRHYHFIAKQSEA